MAKPDGKRQDLRDAFFDALCGLAEKDGNLLFITADMGAWSLSRFRERLPRQFLNIGICEQSMISIAAGLALGGKKVFVYSIVPFVVERCYEQVKVDIAGMGLPVTLVGSGPGFSYSSDGFTHHSLEDMAAMRALPGMTILTPSDETSSAGAARIAYEASGPVYVRLDKGAYPVVHTAATDLSAGVLRLRGGRHVTLVSTGVMIHNALAAADVLAGKGIDAGVLDVFRVKPLNTKALLRQLGRAPRIVTIEEHSLFGGLGSAVSETLSDAGVPTPLLRLAVGDSIHKGHGDREWLHKTCGMDTTSIVRRTLAFLARAAGSRRKAARVRTTRRATGRRTTRGAR